MSSRSSASFARRPTIDRLVEIARASGKATASSRTIRHWVSRGWVDPPRRAGRDYRYPLRAVGQVDTLARWNPRSRGVPLVRFALFIEVDSVDVKEALEFARRNAAKWQSDLEAERARLRGPELLRREAEKAAAMRGRNSALPRQVRTSAEERVAAAHEALQLMLDPGASTTSVGVAMLERTLGLRSGRGGASRETPLALTNRDIEAMDAENVRASLVAAGPAQAKVARHLVELLCVWFPALLPSLAATATPQDAKFLEIAAAYSAHVTPEIYLRTFGTFIARQTKLPEDLLHEIEPALRPAPAMLEMLASQPQEDVGAVLSRLRPLQRLKLEALLRVAANPKP